MDIWTCNSCLFKVDMGGFKGGGGASGGSTPPSQKKGKEVEKK